MGYKLQYKSIGILLLRKIQFFISIYGDPREKKESWSFFFRFYGG